MQVEGAEEARHTGQRLAAPFDGEPTKLKSGLSDDMPLNTVESEVIQ